MTEEKNYKDWLVVSDIDGTLNDKRRNLPERNLKAITEFVKKGGNFTLASSRNPESLYRHYRKLPITTPAIVSNGTGIYDFENKKYLYYQGHSEKAKDDIIMLKRKHPTCDAVVFTKDDLYIAGAGWWSLWYVTIDRLSHKFIHDMRKIPRDDWGKIIINGPWWRISKVRREFEDFPNREFSVVKTSFVSFEVIPKGINKGSSVKELAKILGVEQDHTAAIGDYYNDVNMLKSVEYPACAGQAPDRVRAISKYIACHCNEGAVGDFLEYLINEIIEK